jgi:hypothetical protein
MTMAELAKSVSASTEYLNMQPPVNSETFDQLNSQSTSKA